MKQLEVDSMPVEVATAYLTTRRVKLSSSFKRNCQRTRAKYFVSENVPKLASERLAHKFSKWSIDRLHRQSKRTLQRIAIVQGRMNRIEVASIHAEVLQTVMLPLIEVGNAVQEEILRRSTAVKNHAQK